MSDEEMQSLVDAVSARLGSSWAEAVAVLRDENALGEVEQRIRDGDVDGAVQGVQDAADAFAAAVHDGYVTAGETAATWLAKQLASPIRFDIENKRASAWAKANAADLAEGFTTEQKAIAKRVITDGIEAGTNPRQIARDLRNYIGLTEQQVGYIDSYRHALESGDWSNALGRELSDGRSDRSIVAARDADRTLTADQIDTMVERYQSNMITYRAETIARHEALRSVHSGTHEMFRQAVDAGHVEADALERTWHHTNAGRHPRESHEAMDDDTRGIDEPFTTGDGIELMFPGDPDAPIEETAGCRCAVSTRLVA